VQVKIEGMKKKFWKTYKSPSDLDLYPRENLKNRRLIMSIRIWVFLALLAMMLLGVGGVSATYAQGGTCGSSNGGYSEEDHGYSTTEDRCDEEENMCIDPGFHDGNYGVGICGDSGGSPAGGTSGGGGSTSGGNPRGANPPLNYCPVPGPPTIENCGNYPRGNDLQSICYGMGDNSWSNCVRSCLREGYELHNFCEYLFIDHPKCWAACAFAD
jgi:hypothetical protein